MKDLHPVSFLSPAMKERKPGYRFGGNVPCRIKMLKTVRPDCPVRGPLGTVLVSQQVYDCWVNSYGAVAGICANGEKLGVLA